MSIVSKAMEKRVLPVVRMVQGSPLVLDKRPVLLNLIRPPMDNAWRSEAMKLIAGTKDLEDSVTVSLKGFERGILYPKKVSFEDLVVTLMETVNRDHPHYYQAPCTRLGQDDVVVDCGAAEGLFTFWNLHKVSKAILIEPLDDFMGCLGSTFEGERKAKLVHAALWSEEGTANIVQDGTSSRLEAAGGPDGEKQSIPLMTLDRVLENEDRVDFIKADLEGSEVGAILGARDTIRKHRPKIAITTYHRPEHARELRDLIRRFCPEYRFRTKGALPEGYPVMLHAWVD